MMKTIQSHQNRKNIRKQNQRNLLISPTKRKIKIQQHQLAKLIVKKTKQGGLVS